MDLENVSFFIQDIFATFRSLSHSFSNIMLKIYYTRQPTVPDRLYETSSSNIFIVN